jgi:hypothetical protein
MGVFQNNLLAASAAAASAGGAGFYDYQIEQSMRFDRVSDTGLTRTQTTGTSRRTYTHSVWIKIANNDYNGVALMIFAAAVSSSTNKLDSWNFNTGGGSGVAIQAIGYNGGTNGSLNTTGVYRDYTGWGHYVLTVDTTQSTASDRVKLYLNGTQITSFSSATYPAQNYDGGLGNNSFELAVGMNADNANFGHELDGYMAEYHYTDGTAYAPTQFGETKNGVWIPKDPTGTSYGNNGHYLKFENASDLGNDSSGNNNDFTVENAGADHQVLDSPTFGS